MFGGIEGMDWTKLAQECISWPDLVKMIMSLRIPYRIGDILTE
jgi:hypothetical protein